MRKDPDSRTSKPSHTQSDSTTPYCCSPDDALRWIEILLDLAFAGDRLAERHAGEAVAHWLEAVQR